MVSTTSATLTAAAHPDRQLQSLVDRLVDPDNGETAIYVRNLSTGAMAATHEDEVFPSASLSKVPILVTVYRALATGTLHSDDLITITADAITGGAGVLQARVGDQLTVAELLRLSVSVSDNVAARLLMLHVGGADAVDQTMATMGLRQTRLYSDDRPNITTASEMATLMAWIATQSTRPIPGAPAITEPAANARRAGTGASALPGAPDPRSLSALLSLPQAQSWLAQDLPSGVQLAHKSGQLPGVRHEAGILYTARGPIVAVGLTSGLSNQDDAETFLARLGAELSAATS